MVRYNNKNKKGRRPRKYAKPMRYKVADMAYKAFRGFQYIKGLVNSETFFIVNSASSTPDTSGSVIHLSPVSIGDGQSARTGNSILAKNLFGRIVFNQNVTAVTTRIRFLILRDTQQIGDTSPAVTDVLNSADVLSPLNATLYPGRFNILYDQLILLDDTLRQTCSRKIYIKLNNHIKYNGSATSDIAKNGLYMLMISTQGTNTPTVDYNLKLSYHDN